ncbi:hypothetical protein AVEN_242899-1 [Araneus ventricosus]|uniref:Uncharacterized protein n=1 Tax=Araneus ventricosus TaxID=182803 RepID=A0A4Y2H9J9_ARAVE|nr:hypothetical protein AVEN_242899-1 [Araneus ventricosus]
MCLPLLGWLLWKGPIISHEDKFLLFILLFKILEFRELFPPPTGTTRTWMSRRRISKRVFASSGSTVMLRVGLPFTSDGTNHLGEESSLTRQWSFGFQP